MKISDLKIATRLYLGYGVLIGITGIVVGIAYANVTALDSANDANVLTYQALSEVDGAMQALVDIETGERGYALTGQEAS
ncbi:MAG: CHASE3 domain-containing protein, partial [Telluria sp.]